MINLTKEQIESIIKWMNTWEQLKDTAIPIRFEQDFYIESKAIPELSDEEIERAAEQLQDDYKKV